MASPLLLISLFTLNLSVYFQQIRIVFINIKTNRLKKQQIFEVCGHSDDFYITRARQCWFCILHATCQNADKYGGQYRSLYIAEVRSITRTGDQSSPHIGLS